MVTQMTLAEFYNYTRENQKRIADVYREIEEIQFQFNELHSQQMKERQALIALSTSALLDPSAQVPAVLAQRLTDAEVSERQILTEQMHQLETNIAEKRRSTDGFIAQAQQQVANLRQQNPILNQQEEELKARQARLRDDIQRLDHEIRAQSGLPFRWLLGAGKRGTLHKEQQKLSGNLQSVTDGVRLVRERWQAEKVALQNGQTELQQKWDVLSTEIAQLQAKLDYLKANLDQEVKRGAAQRLLGDLQEAPPVEGPWNERLTKQVDLNHNRSNYEAGLTAVAEMLGVLKGLGEGMDRFQRSVATVYEEQRRYRLASINLQLSDAVTSLHSAWPAFQAKIKDERYMGTHPLEFHQRVQDFVRDRLNEDSIKRMFEDMGNALNRATQAWK
jgi:hypothetical protein